MVFLRAVLYWSFAAILFFALLGAGVSSVYAESVDELRNKISSYSDEIQKLEQEIQQYEAQLQEVGAEKQSLNNAIKTLTLTQKKLETDIAVTENRINATNLSIEKLNIEINNKEKELQEGNEALAGTMRKIYETEEVSLVEVVLSNDTISSFLEDIDNLERLQDVMRVRLKEIEAIKKEFEEKVIENKRAKANLVSYTNELGDQKYIVQQNKSEKNTLLVQTKNKESNYKSILEEKLARKEAFEQELRDYEARLKIIIDQSKLPPIGSQVLSWPLDIVRITQYFGNTKFAQSGAYNRNGHNGIDLGAAQGTAVRSAASGTVKGVGNTDSIPKCYSYGKWVLIEHENGLSTLYAHLSLIKVNAGDIVERGGIIGYSGSTGYSTGPHLHFTVYASQGVVIQKFDYSINCKNAFVPIASLNAYLNPLNYLPTL